MFADELPGELQGSLYATRAVTAARMPVVVLTTLGMQAYAASALVTTIFNLS